MQNEILKETAVPGSNGLIDEPGWARTEVMKYHRENVRAPWYRKKEWDYYLFTNERFGVAFTISDLGYVGLLSVSFLDFVEKTDFTDTDLVWFPRGRKFGLGTEIGSAGAECHTKRLDLVFTGRNHIKCDFRGKKHLTADLTLYSPGDEALYIATPWKEKPTAFYLNCKMNCFEAEGTVTLDDRTETVTREDTLGVLDWGRGVWTYDNTWYWGTGSGRVNGEPFGFNLGYGFSDRSAASENAVIYKGRISKLSEVNFDFSKGYLEPWTITSDDGRFEAVFNPIIDRNALMDFKVIISDQHQVFGRMTGYAVLDDGEKIEFKDFVCAIEKVRNKY